MKTLVHVFISSRLDYCNSSLYGINDALLKKLQAVQNAAARVTTETRKFDHITPVLSELHWLPMHKRIIYKLAVTVHPLPGGEELLARPVQDCSVEEQCF